MDNTSTGSIIAQEKYLNSNIPFHKSVFNSEDIEWI